MLGVTIVFSFHVHVTYIVETKVDKLRKRVASILFKSLVLRMCELKLRLS